ncbi:MAG TPA: hypothetical protein VMN36_12355 [Verrucomicrobiales bacterium]|nr:hypothetical protein [Verrucomicrobiales bacterium]
MHLERQWNLGRSAAACAHTGRPFQQEEEIYTALFELPGEDDRVERRDYSSDAWQEISPGLQPFSFWKSRFVPPPPPDAPAELVEKDSAAALLRRLLTENDPSTVNARYILAIMLERRRIFVQTGAKVDRKKRRILIFRHRHSDEVFLVEDPGLRLDQLAAVQAEVGALLGLAPPSGVPKAPESAG